MRTGGPDKETANAIRDTLQSSNCVDTNLKIANVVDVLSNLGQATYRISTAISDDAMPGTDAVGGRVGCMVEAMMGMTAGLVQIADALNNVAEAIRETKE